MAELEAGLADAGRRGRPRAGGSGGPHWGRIAAVAVLAIVLLGCGWVANSLFQPFGGDGEGEVRVTIPPGSSLGQIADLLERDGVVSSASFFQLRARIAGRSDELKPGTYALRRNMSFSAALAALERGVPPDVVRVTIPEGRSRREIAPLVRGTLSGSYLRASVRSPLLDPRDYGAKHAANLEGFLFPATYELKRGKGARALVDEQLRTFKHRFAGVDLRYARSKNLTPYDVLIIASMVEREAQVARERPMVASVIYNRLSRQMTLGIDATIRFALNQWDAPLRASELANPTPYNTRLNQGLPPGPIGNPGIASIRAAARPARTDYLFYVVKPCGEGQHAFSSTDAQFQRDVDRYNTERAKRGGNSPASC
ncbi:MAG TPA: endolytic transglycosylase MltG [Thermoleophilaceae bacterium]